MAKYGKTQGSHCWSLTRDGKILANFDDENEVDAIIDLEKLKVKIEVIFNIIIAALSVMLILFIYGFMKS